MIYDGPITDPRHRYYMPAAQHGRNYTEISPRSLDRYAKFRSQPVNLSRMAPAANNLSSSNIYTKQGLLKRNEIGWDGVKLTEYVTEQLSQNYLENQRVLEKFRLEAEQSRRLKKFRHAYERDQTGSHHLPPISPKQQELSRYTPSPLYQSIEQDEIIEEEPPHYRNVGVNTHKYYEKVQLQKYAHLMSKYENMKEKYRKEKQRRRREKRKYEQLEERKQKQRESIDKIKDIQLQLINISIKLEASNELLSQKLAEQSRKKEAHDELSRVKMADTRRLKTQPEISESESRRWEIPEPELSIRDIPENPLKKINKNKEVQKTPTVVYSKTNDFNNSKFLTKYNR